MEARNVQIQHGTFGACVALTVTLMPEVTALYSNI